MDSSTATTIVTQVEAADDHRAQAAKFAAAGDLTAAATVAGLAAEAYADVAEACAGTSVERAQVYAAAAARASRLAETLADLVALAGTGVDGEAATSAVFADRAARRAMIAADPLLGDDDLSAAGLTKLAQIAEVYGRVNTAAERAADQEERACLHSELCGLTVVALDADQESQQAQQAADAAMCAAVSAERLAHHADPAAAATAARTSGVAVSAAIRADQAAARARLVAGGMGSDEQLVALRARISAATK